MIWTDDLYRLHDLDPGDIPQGSKEHIARGLQCYEPDDRPIILAVFNRYAETDESYDLEFLFTNFKGNRIWIRTAGKSVKKYGKVTKIVGSFVDITERKAVERAMNQSEAKFRLLYEIAPVAYQSLDESGCFLDVNQAFLDSVG